MRIVQSWLKQYTAVPLAPQELADKLTMLGLEFEAITNPGEKYKGFVVGEVLEASRHPNADRLTVCRVNVGKEELQIVCGAPNVAAGQKVPVGLVGATVPKNQHDPNGPPFVLQKVKLRGVESSGMICSAFELDLGKDADGILVLDADAKVGQPLAKHLGVDDIVYDIEITPNRPDWLSHVGFARELRVLTGKPVKLPAVRVREGKEQIRKYVDIKVEDTKNCIRFAARMVRGVKIGPSPRWLQDWLKLAGLRPINNVVDITNFVMLECGQPMHAFDYSLLEGRKLVIKPAGEGLKFKTLDGQERQIPPASVMVCDAVKPVSIAGVMGGENSEIQDATVDVVLESANWYPSSIRLTAKALGLSTDASQRYERGADPNIVEYALNRATALVAELAGGTILKGVIDVYPKTVKERLVTLRPSRANAVIGINQPAAAMVKSLRLLGLRPVKQNKQVITFAVPTYRIDLEREIDLIEEIARVYGYDNIEDKTRTSVDFLQPFPKVSPADPVRNRMIAAGLHEVVTNSMHDEQRARLSGAEPVKILNPQNQDMGFLRTSLIPGMLDVVVRNINFKMQDLRLFEIGHVFSKDSTAASKLVEDFLEEERVAILMTGAGAPLYWGEKSRLADLYDLKGVVENFLEAIALDKCRVFSYPTASGLTESALAIEIAGSYAGYAGKVQSSVLKFFGIEQDVFVAEIALSGLSGRAAFKYRPLPKYHPVRRDVAFGVPADTAAGTIVDVITKTAGELLARVDVFDVYEGSNVPAGTKSIAFALELMSREKVLTEAEIEAVVQRVVREVEKECGATLRGMK
jgi:phenylalanyl-tRNA synthetase beta chain